MFGNAWEYTDLRIDDWSRRRHDGFDADGAMLNVTAPGRVFASRSAVDRSTSTSSQTRVENGLHLYPRAVGRAQDFAVLQTQAGLIGGIVVSGRWL